MPWWVAYGLFLAALGAVIVALTVAARRMERRR